MVLLQYAAEKVLSPILSEYVEGFNTENMKIGLWSGKVEIKDVSLKKDMMKKLNLPFNIKYSKLGSLVMTIPWKSLANSKTEIILDGIEIIINQVPQAQWQCKNNKIIETRKKQVQEYCQNIINDFAKKAQNSKQEDQGFINKMVMRILDNLQITVKNIHIRFQDQITKQYSFGVTLEELSINTVNKNDQPEFIDRTLPANKDEPLRKKLLLSNFGVYWNQKTEFFSEKCFHQRMMDTIARSQKKPQLNYLILMTSKAKLIQKQYSQNMIDPQTQLSVEFNELNFDIINLQLQQIVTLIQRLQKFKSKVQQSNRSIMSPQEISLFLIKFNAIYQKISSKIVLTEEQQKTYQTILQKVDVANLTPLIKKILQENQKGRLIKDKQNKSRGWFSGPKQLTEKQIKQIQQYLEQNFGTEVKAIIRPQNYFYLGFHLRLKRLRVMIGSKSGSLHLKQQTLREGIETEFNEIELDFRLRTNGYKMNFQVEDLKVDLVKQLKDQRDKLISLQKCQIIRKWKNSEQKNAKYFLFSLESNPLNQIGIDLQISLVSTQLLITFNSRLIKIIKDFSNISVSADNKDNAIQKYGQLKEFTANSVNQSIKEQRKKKCINVDVTLNSAKLIVFLDPNNVNGNCWGLDLGKIKIFSDQQTLKAIKISQKQPMQKYMLSITNFSHTYFKSKNSLIKFNKGEKISKQEVIPVVANLNLDLNLQIFANNTKEIPKIRLNCKLHQLNLNLTGFIYNNLLKMGQCFKYQELENHQMERIQTTEKQKTQIKKNSRKIGIVYLRVLTFYRKYFAIYSGNYIYFYAQSKDTEYDNYVFTKNAILNKVINKQASNLQKPYVLQVNSKLGEQFLGFDRLQSMNQWASIIQQTNKKLTQIFTNQNDGKVVKVGDKKNHDDLIFQLNLGIQKIFFKAVIDEQEGKYIDLSVRQLTTRLYLCESKIEVKIGLRYIQMQDNITIYKMQRLKKLLYTVEQSQDDKLVDISIAMMNKDHPLYDNCDLNVQCSFGTLICNFKPQTISSLLLFFIPKKQIKKANIQEKPITGQIKIEQQVHEEIKSKEIFSIKAKVAIDNITLTLINSKTNVLLSKMSIIGFQTCFGLSNKQTSITGSLGELSYEDFSGYPFTNITEKDSYQEDSNHLIRRYQKKIDSLELIALNFQKIEKQKLEIQQTIKQPLIQFNISIFNFVKQNNKKIFVKASLRNLEISYLQQPILRIITYLNTQMLPSLILDSPKNQVIDIAILQKIRPQNPSMDLNITLQNISILLEPPSQNIKQLLKLNIEEINVTNETFIKTDLILDYKEGQQKIIVQRFIVRLKSLGISAKYANNNMKQLTNLMDLSLAVNLVQNPYYYSKIYQEKQIQKENNRLSKRIRNRFLNGIRVTTEMTPFFINLNHQDYKFIMKALNWCVTYEDNADQYLYTVSQIKVDQEVQIQGDPLYFDMLIERISLCVGQTNIPVCILTIDNLKLYFNKLQQNMEIKLSLGDIVGTAIEELNGNRQPKYIQKGLFNTFGYQKTHESQQLESVIKLSKYFHNYDAMALLQKNNCKFKLQMNSDKFNSSWMKIDIGQIKLVPEIKTLLILSSLVILDDSILPPKPKTKSLKPVIQVPIKKIEGGKNNIEIHINDFVASLTDSRTRDCVVLQGRIDANFLIRSPPTQQFVLKQFQYNIQKNIEISYYNINIIGLEVYFCNLKSKTNKRSLLRPLKIQSSLSQYYQCKEIKIEAEKKVQRPIFYVTNFEAEVGNLNFQATLKDILRINTIIQDNLNLLGNKQIQVEKMRKIQEDKDFVPEKDKLQKVDTNFIEKLKDQSTKKIVPRNSATVSLQPIELTVVNDFKGNFMPVLKFIMHNTILNYQGVLIRKQLQTILTFGASFFNSRSSKWEPFIQMCQIQVYFLIIGQTNQLIITSTKEQELKELKFNISTQLIAVLMQTFQIIKKEKDNIEEMKETQKIQVSPYIFQNNTNQTISVKRRIDSTNHQYIDLPPLFYGPLRLSQNAKFLQFKLLGKSQKLSLQHYGMVRIPQTQYLVQFKVEKLSRFIRFTANKVLTNQLYYRKIYCKLIDHQKKQINLIIDCHKMIPLDFISSFCLSLDGNKYSHEIVVGKCEKNHIVYGQKLQFQLSLAIQSSQFKNKNKILCYDNYIIRSPLLIYNCLPKAIKMQFLVDNKLKATKDIQPQSQHQVFANKSIYQTKLRILIPGIQMWSQQFGLEDKILKRKMKLTISDQFPTTINYMFTKMEKTQHHILVISCQKFIVSEIAEPIRIYGNLDVDQKDKKIQKYYQLGGQKDNDFDQKKILLVGSQIGTKLRICGKNSLFDFSQPVVIGGIGMSQTRVVIEKEIKGKKMNLFTILGVQISLRQMHRDLQIFSNEIIIRARSIVINNTGRKLFIREQQAKQFLFEINDKEKKPFFFTMPQLSNENKLHSLIVRGQNTQQSNSVSIQGLGTIYFKLFDNQSKKDLYFKAVIQSVKSYLFFSIQTVSQSDLPYQIVVKSKVLQVYVKRFNRRIDYQQKLNYFNEFSQKQQKFQLTVTHKDYPQQINFMVQVDNLNFYHKFRISIQIENSSFMLFGSCYVMISDSKKFLVIEEASNEEIIEEVDLQKINIKLQKISFSFIQNHISIEKPFESFYFYLYNLQFFSSKTNLKSLHQLRLQFLQFDQSDPFSLMNPVVITPQKYKKFMNQENPKFIFNTLIQIDNSFKRNLFINKFCLQFNDLVVKVSSEFITIILKMIEEFQNVMKVQESDFVVKTSVEQWKGIELPQEESRTFIKSITIAPFTTIITAQLNLGKSDETNNQQVLRTVLNALGVVITNIEDAPIVLDGLQVTDCVDTLQGIQIKLIQHYKSSVMNQFYKIFGSLNILGNPIGLFRNISSGIKDFQDKPVEGFVQGPMEFGKGLAEGTSSLIAHSVGGALNSVQKFTGTVATGLAALSFDTEFQEKRKKQKMNKPKHIFDGLGKGGAAVFFGFKEGITGVFTKPYENTKKQGFTGFFKGAAQGLAGLIIKPVTGIIDFASKTTQGLKNTALYMEDKPNENRIRYPRVFYTQCLVVRGYNSVDSKINFILHKQKYLSQNPKTYFFDTLVVDAKTCRFIAIMRNEILFINLDKEQITDRLPIEDITVGFGSVSYGDGIIIKSNNGFQQFISMGSKEEIKNMIELVESIKREYL